ncbi:MAG: biopolymer transporter ExbD, partial [Planctomycetota bacterium]
MARRSRRISPSNRRTAADGHINVTPLIDVVMVLIIFYLVVGHLVLERRGDIDLPEATAGEQEDTTREPIVIAVRTDGAIALDGRDVGRLDLERALLNEAGRPVQVRADRAIRYELVRPVIEAIVADPDISVPVSIDT